MSFLRIDVQVDETSTYIDRLLSARSGTEGECLARIAEVLNGLASGVRNGVVRLVTGAVRGVGTITFTGNPVAAETVTINGVAFTARASGAVANEFNIGSGATANALALANAINASTTAKVKGVIKATPVAGVITLECLVPGAIGLLCTLAKTLTNATVSGANFTLGAENTPVVINRGRS